MKLFTNTPAQTIYCTLKDVTPSNAVNWFLEFENVSSNVLDVCQANAVEHNDRYTSFTITTATKISVGGVEILQAGYYLLRVYWRTSESTPNASRLLETRLVQFVPAVATARTIVSDTNNEQIVYFEG